MQDRKLTLTKAIDICRSSETTKKQAKKIQANSEANEGEINDIVNNKTKPEAQEPEAQEPEDAMTGVSDLIGVTGA